MHFDITQNLLSHWCVIHKSFGETIVLHEQGNTLLSAAAVCFQMLAFCFDFSELHRVPFVLCFLFLQSAILLPRVDDRIPHRET